MMRRPLRNLTDRELASLALEVLNSVDPALLDAAAFREYADLLLLFLETLNLNGER